MGNISMSKNRKIMIICSTVAILVVITILVCNGNRIMNIFDELYYNDARKKGSIDYLFMDYKSYKYDSYGEKDGSESNGILELDWITSIASSGKKYTIENARYTDQRMSINVTLEDASGISVKYEYYYDVKKKELRPNIFVYGMLNDNQNLGEAKEVNLLVEEAKGIIDGFLNDLIVNNTGRTKFTTEDWGGYNVSPEQRIEYRRKFIKK